MKFITPFISACCLVVLFFAQGLFAADNQVQLDASTSRVNLNRVTESLRVTERSQLSEVQSMSNWNTSLETVPLSEQQALWLRFAIDHSDSQSARFSLVVGNPSINYLDVYVLDEKSRILASYSVGAKRAPEQRPINHRHFVLPLDLMPNQSLNVYLRIRDDGPAVYNLNLWRTSELIADEQFHLSFIGVISGALMILFCYFLTTYIMLRSPIRFWFAVVNAAILVLFLNVQGLISQVTGLGAYIAQITSVSVALTILAAAKVSHSMLLQVPVYWRFVSYVLAIALIVIAVVFDSYWQIVLGSAITGAAVLLQLLLALMFHNRHNSLPNRLYALGWLIISATAMLDVSLYLSGNLLDVPLELIMSLVVMSGILLIAAAIDGHELVLTRTHQVQQQTTIAGLRQFYDLFKNSAEGLYTSTKEGKLVTTNPAMCQLFGYIDEAQMLGEVHSTAQLYANQGDRELLLGEIFENGMVLGKEVKGKRKDGSEFWFCLSAQLNKNGDEEFLFGSVFDITERKQSSISLEYLATHDSLTGVYNRREFEQKLRVAIRIAKQQKQPLSLLFMDLDQFKIVNDTCGHKAGDMLIKQLSQQFSDVIADKGILARLGGDEFGVILEGKQAQDAEAMAIELLDMVREFRFNWNDRLFSLGLSVGIAHWQNEVGTLEQFLSMADSACYVSKELGRNQIHTYSSVDQKMLRYETELEWVSHINKALEQDRFVLYYQHYYPLTKAADGHHYEILLRMRNEKGEIIPPSSFLPAAERHGLTAEIDKWVILNYFKWLSEHPQHLAELDRCNMNLSGHSLADKELKHAVLNGFEKYRIPYQKICFEITESMAIVKMDETIAFITTFKRLGCAFALDDFGSGFSSYNYLKNLPVDSLKIDGSFVKDLLSDPIDMAMVSSMKDVAKAMGMSTVAEFVESRDVMVALGKMGVDFAQGYGIAEPAPLLDFVPCKTIG